MGPVEAKEGRATAEAAAAGKAVEAQARARKMHNGKKRFSRTNERVFCPISGNKNAARPRNIINDDACEQEALNRLAKEREESERLRQLLAAQREAASQVGPPRCSSMFRRALLLVVPLCLGEPFSLLFLYVLDGAWRAPAIKGLLG